jgi:hypothetical protein
LGDLDATTSIVISALIWLSVIVLIIARLPKSRAGSTGLPLAFVLIYTAMHAGVLVHLVDGYDHTMDASLAALRYTRETVAEGFAVSTLAMVASVIGFAIIDLNQGAPIRRAGAVGFHAGKLRQGSILLLGIGASVLVLDTAMNKIGLSIAGLQAVTANARNLFGAGACGYILHSFIAGNSQRALVLTLAFAVVLPVTFLISSAIFADSIAIAAAIVSFYLVLNRGVESTLGKNLALTAAITFGAFIFAGTYLQTREAIREVIWNDGDLSSSAGAVADAAGKLDVGSSTNLSTLALVDIRLNQNIFIGLAIEKLRALPDTYENGATIALALLGWIPRFVWPDKPERGGSAFIGKHTGKVTAEGTTYGAGPVFEFYVNFASTGVFFGFIVMGAMLRLFDVRAADSLRHAEMPRFAQYYLAGLSMLAPLADLFFIVTSIAASLLISAVLRYGWSKQVVVRAPG